MRGDPEAITAGRDVSRTLVAAPADGSGYTCRVSCSPIATPTVSLTHWVVALQDLTEQLSHDAEQAALVEAERRERRSLGLIAQVSDLLMDVDDPHALREIAAVLRRAVVGWAQFYLNDGGLRPADGIDAGQAPSGRGARHRSGSGRAGRMPSSCCSTARATACRPGPGRLVRGRERVGVARRNVDEQRASRTATTAPAARAGVVFPVLGPTTSPRGARRARASAGCTGSSRPRGPCWS